MNTFQRYLVDEFAEDYQERRLTRRDALKLIASVTGSLIVAEGVLAACTPAPSVENTEAPLETTAPEATQPQAEQAIDASPTEPITVTVTTDNPAIANRRVTSSICGFKPRFS